MAQPCRTIELGKNKVLLLSATKFVVTCYGSSKKLIQSLSGLQSSVARAVGILLPFLAALRENVNLPFPASRSCARSLLHSLFRLQSRSFLALFRQ